MKKREHKQQSIFEWLKRAEEATRQSSNPPMGSLNVDAELRAAVSADIKACPLSRYQIAARMSELVGEEITESMLYSWTAESKDRHRFPAQYIPAFTIAIGERRAVECLSRRSGLFALPGPEALRAEIQRLDEEEKKIKAEKAKRRLYLKEIESAKGK